MNRKYGLRISLVCWLTAVWVLLWGTLSPANILAGLAVALLITLLLPLPVVPVQGRLHPLSLLRLQGRVMVDLAKASLQIAWLTVKPGPPPQSAIVRAPLSVKSDLTLSLIASILTLIAIEDFFAQLAHLEQLVIAAFEREHEWRPADEEATP